LPMEAQLNCVATCRPGLEGVLSAEIEQQGGRQVRLAKRAVHFTTDQAGLYRMNMAIRTAIQILVPLRTFNARDYQLLYFQARKTNWHQYFSADKTVRIDVNGNSPTLRNTQYVIHRVKDGIVDTFRKLNDGIRPSIDKADPDVHVLVHLNGQKVTLYLDSAGIPLFKRGYRTEHGGAPLKEDLAAGILQLSEAASFKGLVDPVCGSGTFLFEGWMLSNNVAPNLKRSFAFQNWADYRPELHEREKAALQSRESIRPEVSFLGCEMDASAIEVARKIHRDHFPEANIEWHHGLFQEKEWVAPEGLMVANPPYGERLGFGDDLGALYKDIGYAAKRMVPGGKLALFTTNRKAARQIRLKAGPALTLFNGSLEGLLYPYTLNRPPLAEDIN
jgi:putative N6-adenine-specific DNA methylase